MAIHGYGCAEYVYGPIGQLRSRQFAWGGWDDAWISRRFSCGGGDLGAAVVDVDQKLVGVSNGRDEVTGFGRELARVLRAAVVTR